MIQIANAPCSWGALEFELEGKSLGYEQVLSEMVETGYAGTELGIWLWTVRRFDDLFFKTPLGSSLATPIFEGRKCRHDRARGAFF